MKPFNHTRLVTIACISLAVISFTGALLAQRGRGGGGGQGRSAGPQNPAAVHGPSEMRGMPSRPEPPSQGINLDRLEKNPAVTQRLQSLMPAGTNVRTAAAGFRNEGEFIAAAHVSRNLGVPFDQLKSRMTGDNGESLGKAVQSLRPDLDSKTVKDQVKAANATAKDELKALKQKQPEGGSGAGLRVNPELSARLTQLLPAGMTFDQASDGFRNTGQFVAALHAARNLSIPYRDLRARMIAGGESLGEAIHALRPEMTAGQIEAGVKGAQEASERDLEGNRNQRTAGSSPN